MSKLCAVCGILSSRYIKVDTDTNNSAYYCRKLECQSVAEQKFNENRTYQTCSTPGCRTLYLPHFSKKSYCDDCIKGKNAQKYAKQYRSENKDKNNERQRQYREEHREEYNAKRRQYYANNKDKICEKIRYNRIDNRDKINKQRRQQHKFKKIKSKNMLLYDTRRKEYLEHRTDPNDIGVLKTLCELATASCKYCGKSNVQADSCDECTQKQHTTEFLLSHGVSFLDIMNERLA